MAKIPGPIGLDEFSGQDFPSRGLGPDFGLDDMAYGRGPIGWGRTCSYAASRAAAAQREYKNAQDELDVLRRLYGMVYDNSVAPKAYFAKDKKKNWVYETDAYIKDRADFFGSTEAYETYLAKAKEELDADKSELRRVIEPQVKVRKQHADWQDGQDVFYAWTKKAFENQVLAVKPDATPDFPAVIKAQMSADLKAKLDTVRKGYKTTFTAGGFNPRPQKISGGYRFGTLSEHAVGNAIDIDDQKNPQIEGWRWTAILAYTGKTWNAGDLTTKWQSKDAATAKGVYDALKAISDEWSSKLEKAVKASEDAAKKKAEEAAAAKKKAEEEAAKKKPAVAAATAVAKGVAAPVPPPPPAAPPVDHLALVIAADANLKTINAGKDEWVKEWKGGFLNLEWDLVKELHKAGFTWGVVFSNPDIHHFEL